MDRQSSPPQQRALVDSTDVPIRPVVTPQIRRARQQAVDDATAAVAEAVRARTDAAASAVHVADLDIALAELQRELARTRMWQPALAELTPTTPARHTPYPARIAVPILPAPTDPTTTDPTTTDPTTSAPGASEPTVPTAPTGDTDVAAHPSAGRATPEPSAAGSSAPQEAMPHTTADAPVAPDLAVATEGTAASDPTVSAAAAPTPDPEAARVLAATTEVERLTSDVRAATAAELAARLAAEEEARQAEEAAAADAARRAAQAASLGAYQNG